MDRNNTNTIHNAQTPKPNREDNIPKTRPVIIAANGMSTRAAGLLCDMLDAVSKSDPTPQECPSTTHCINKLKDAEDIVEDEA